MTETPQKLYQRVAAQVEAAIEQGRYTINSRLPGERELAEEFKVSRPTVREAMIALEIKGYVEARHGSGVYVRKPRLRTASAELDVGAFELIEARVLFEGEAAALAATTLSDGDIEELEKHLDMMSLQDPGGSAAYEADRQFHLLIATGTRNSLIRETIENLWLARERSPLCIHIFAQAKREGVNPRVDEHRLILDGLRSRDPARARQAMHDHLRRVTEDLLVATETELVERARSKAEDHRRDVIRRTIR